MPDLPTNLAGGGTETNLKLHRRVVFKLANRKRLSILCEKAPHPSPAEREARAERSPEPSDEDTELTNLKAPTTSYELTLEPFITLGPTEQIFIDGAGASIDNTLQRLRNSQGRSTIIWRVDSNSGDIHRACCNETVRPPCRTMNRRKSSGV